MEHSSHVHDYFGYLSTHSHNARSYLRHIDDANGGDMSVGIWQILLVVLLFYCCLVEAKSPR